MKTGVLAAFGTKDVPPVIFCPVRSVRSTLLYGRVDRIKLLLEQLGPDRFVPSRRDLRVIGFERNPMSFPSNLDASVENMARPETARRGDLPVWPNSRIFLGRLRHAATVAFPYFATRACAGVTCSRYSSVCFSDECPMRLLSA